MNYYVLPGTGIYGGIKVGYQFADLLNELGARCTVSTPDGCAPAWFQSSAPTLSEADLFSRLTARDNLLFSLPHDHPRLAALPARLVFHCQGTDPLINPAIADPKVTILTCWPQAAAYVREHTGRTSIEVGISVADCFFYDGRPKIPGTVAFMPRRGSDLAAACQRALPHLRFIPIANASERAVAAILQSCEYYIATSLNEWFGLPALEAMAAGCVVASVPTVGGRDYLEDASNCRIAAPDELPATLGALASPGALAIRARLRDRARVTAAAFRKSLQRKSVAELLKTDLSFLRP